MLEPGLLSPRPCCFRRARPTPQPPPGGACVQAAWATGVRSCRPGTIMEKGRPFSRALRRPSLQTGSSVALAFVKGLCAPRLPALHRLLCLAAQAGGPARISPHFPEAETNPARLPGGLTQPGSGGRGASDPCLSPPSRIPTRGPCVCDGTLSRGVWSDARWPPCLPRPPCSCPFLLASVARFC